MCDQPVVDIEGAFHFADGNEVWFAVLPDGTVRQRSGALALSEFERPRFADTMPMVLVRRDALLDSGLGDVDKGPLGVVPVPESADTLTWHLMHDHVLSAHSILNWLLIRSEDPRPWGGKLRG